MHSKNNDAFQAGGPAGRAAAAGSTAALSAAMLAAVLHGDTYAVVAARHGRSRTAVERRIKALAAHLTQRVGIHGLTEEGTAFVSRLRRHKDAILSALDSFEPGISVKAPVMARILSPEEIAQAALRIKGRSSRPWHDLSLFYVLLATGARPLEIARLQVRDYLYADGSVRRNSQIRAEVAICQRPRCLYFASTRLDEVLSRYLQERLEAGLGVHAAPTYRGLDPDSRLFLSASGEGFRITRYGKAGQARFLCRAILDTYDKLFRYAGLKQFSARLARRTVASRLYERGADEDQVGTLLGIGERSAVRALLSRRRPTLAELVEDLV